MNSVIIRKEIKENFFAMKGFLWLTTVTILFSIMTFSFVSVKELSLMAQTEVMLTLGKLVIVISILITMILSSVSFSNEREQSTLESLMLTPVTGMQMAIAKLMGVFFMWIAIYTISIPYLLSLSFGTLLGFNLILIVLILGSIIIFIYSAISIGLSIIMGSSKNAMITSIIIFVISAVPYFLSTTMKKAGFGKFINMLSPLTNALDFMKNTIINRLDLLHTATNYIPLLICAVAAYIFLNIAVSKFSFEGGE